MTSTTESLAAPRQAHPFARFLTRRLVRLLVSLLVVITGSFSLIHLVPGDPVRAALGLSAPAELVEARRHELGLDQPLLTQYVHYLGGLFRGDLGTSISTGQPVARLLTERLGATLALGGLAFLVVILIALPAGVCAAALTRGGRRRGVEVGFAGVTGLLAALPEFLLATGLVFVFGVSLSALPVAGRTGADSYVLPVLALALVPAAALARIVRVECLNVLTQDYIRTARAKRLRTRLIYLRHVLPNMVTASLTIGGLLLSGMIAGTILVENVFAWPGLGSTIVRSILSKDYALVQGIVLVYGTAVLLVNLLVDICLGLLDPRSTVTDR